MTWIDAVLDAWAVLFPVECAGCGAPDRAVCVDCRAALTSDPTPRTTAGGLTVVTALRYEGVPRRVLLALKEQERLDVATALSRPLAAALAAARPGAAELTPVPTSRAAYRRRGFDPVALLLRRAGYRPVRVLRHTRSIGRQKTLGAAERAANLRGALAARRPLGGRRFVLIDDVLTTGATLDEAARAIREGGGEVDLAICLAFTPRLLPIRDIAERGD